MRRIALTVVLAAVVTATAASPAMASLTYKGFHVQAPLSADPPSTIETLFSRAAGAGSNVVRLDVSWGSLESGGKGQLSSWYVSQLDHTFAAARARGLRIIATFWKTPCWASSAPDSLKQGCQGAWWDRGVTQYPPTNPSDYGDAGRWLVSRYHADLAAVEIWNEPNFPGGVYFSSASPAADYARLVRGSYALFKAGAADVPVLAGALSKADLPFLYQLYANGIKGFADGISIHPYNEWRAPGAPWADVLNSTISGTQWVQAGQRAAGDFNPLWITEFGWTTATNTTWHVDEIQQGAYDALALRLLDATPGVKAAVVYELQDSGTDPTAFGDNFGVLNRDLSPKPAYAAISAAMSAVGGPPASRSFARKGKTCKATRARTTRNRKSRARTRRATRPRSCAKPRTRRAPRGKRRHR